VRIIWLTGPSGNDIRECALEATDELIIRLLGVVAKIRRKYVSDHFIFLFLREEAQMPFTHVQKKRKKKERKKERVRTDCGTLRVTLRVVCAEGCAGSRRSVGQIGLRRLQNLL
jgi:hypothetical protein